MTQGCVAAFYVFCGKKKKLTGRSGKISLEIIFLLCDLPPTIYFKQKTLLKGKKNVILIYIYIWNSKHFSGNENVFLMTICVFIIILMLIMNIFILARLMNIQI